MTHWFLKTCFLFFVFFYKISVKHVRVHTFVSFSHQGVVIMKDYQTIREAQLITNYVEMRLYRFKLDR